MTPSRKIANATGLYMEGIRDGHPRAAQEKYAGARYVQHSTGVPDGKEGFIEFFDDFLARNPVRDIRVVRALEDGQYVFLHVFQSLNDGEARWVTADLFDTDEDDRMIEHWDVIQEYVEEGASGSSMIDGETDVRDFDRTEANQAVVRAFVRDVLQGEDPDRVAEYVSADVLQHSPHVEDGLDGLRRYLSQLAEEGRSPQYLKVHHLLGQGNFVVTYSHVRMGEDELAVFDLFRLEGGKIAEHWDVAETIGPPETWNNSGKF